MGLRSNFLAFLLLIYAGSAAADPIFTPADFGYTELWRSGNRAHDEFANWASDLANRAIEMLERKESIETVFNTIAKGRAKFAVDQNHVVKFKVTGNRNAFGKWRKGDIRWGWNVVKGPEGSVEGRIFREIEAQLLTRADERGGYVNPYVTLDGRVIAASRITAPENGICTIFHPMEEDLNAIRADVLERLKRLSTGPVTADFDDAFFRAMNGYHQAMSYERGGAAIGRVFFAAFYRERTGKKLPDFKTIDVEALILDPDEFVARHRVDGPLTDEQIRSFVLNGLCPDLVRAP